ncbi:uncharacterized protein LOC125784857 [Astyanax mexicanus]|uniref:uncharacterized protein LOC125784857 n=1 Tax=Astyanax mexicanus TaxID=7994 RepID=UPI0020CB5415|nr:uncharacterized protein LOC125784857 [Astyanax mexicanus]
MCATEKALLELTAGLPPGLTIPVQQMDSGGLHALIAKSLNECVSKILEGKQQVDPISLILGKQLLLSQDQLAVSSKTIQNLQAEIVTLNDRVADLENKTVQSEINQRDLKTEVQLLQKEANIATQLAAQSQEKLKHAIARQVELQTELAHANNAVKLTRDQTELTFELMMEGDSPINPAGKSGTPGVPDPKQQPSTNTFPLVSLKGAEAPVEPRFTQRSQPHGTSVQPQAPSDRDLDKIARNIPRFEPEPDGSNDVHQYLRDIDFFLRRFPKATVNDKIYLIKVSSSREVGRFIERQPPQVKRDYPALCKALEDEFSNHLAQTGLAAALAIKQSRQETPLQYYHRLRHAYFGYRNEPGMEEEEVFKTLFVRNLHPSTSHFFGVAACPRTLTSRQLRDLALRGFAKFQQNIKKKSESNDVLIINEQSSHVKQKGAHKAPMPPKTQLNHKNQRVFHSWRRSSLHWAKQSDQKPSYRRKGRIKRSWNGKHSQHHARAQSSSKLQSPLRRKSPKHHKRWCPPKGHKHETYPTNLSTKDGSLLRQFRDEIRKQDNAESEFLPIVHAPDQPAWGGAKSIHPNAALVVQPDAENNHTEEASSLSLEDPPPKQFLGFLTEKGSTPKFYLATRLEDVFGYEALLDTGSDISLMSNSLFDQVRATARRNNKEIPLKKCALHLQPYSHTGITLHSAALVHVAIGPMSLTHPIHISPLENVPLLFGKDLLDRFKPLIDFQHRRIWAQVCEPLPCPKAQDRVQCYHVASNIEPHKLIEPSDSTGINEKLTVRVLKPPSSESPTMILKQNTCSWALTPSTAVDEYNPKAGKSFTLNTTVNGEIFVPWADKSAVHRPPAGSLPRTNCDPLFVHQKDCSLLVPAPVVPDKHSPLDSYERKNIPTIYTDGCAFRNAQIKWKVNMTIGACDNTSFRTLAFHLDPLATYCASFRMLKGLFVYAPDTHASSSFVVPQRHGGESLAQALDHPWVDHKMMGETHQAFPQLTYLPLVGKRLVCFQPQSSEDLCGIWPIPQMDWVERNKHLITVAGAFARWRGRPPDPIEMAQATTLSLIHTFSGVGISHRSSGELRKHPKLGKSTLGYQPLCYTADKLLVRSQHSTGKTIRELRSHWFGPHAEADNLPRIWNQIPHRQCFIKPILKQVHCNPIKLCKSPMGQVGTNNALG